MVAVPFMATYQQKWNGSSWVSIPVAPNTTATLQMIFGDSHAMILVPMAILYDPVRPIRPRPK